MAQPDIQIDLRQLEFISRATIELSHAMGRMARIGHSIAYLGSNQITHDSPHKKYYELAMEISEVMGREGWNCITGGGTGIAEAVILGSGLGRAKSVSMRLIPQEKKVNRNPNVWVKLTNPFNRKVLFDLFTEAYVFFPGGFGTLDALFEALTLQQTRKIDPKPIICVGTDFWKPLLDPLIAQCLKPKYKTISPQDRNLLYITDNYRDIARIIWENRDKILKTKGFQGLPEARSASSRRTKAFAHKVAVELILAFNTFHGLGEGITIFGSARSKPRSKVYQDTQRLAYELGKILVQKGKRGKKTGAIITGGGPGSMEAANKGARLAGAPSLGLGIDLQQEQGFNSYVDSNLAYEFNYFFCRKWLFSALTDILLATPGGYGTFDELFEMIANKQYYLSYNPQLAAKSIVCIHSDFWEEPITHVIDTLLKNGFMIQKHKKLLTFLEPDEAIHQVRKSMLS